MFAKKITLNSKKFGDIDIILEGNKINIYSTNLELRSVNQDKFADLVSKYAAILNKPKNVALLRDGKTWEDSRVEELILEAQNNKSMFGMFSVYIYTDCTFIGSLNIQNVLNEYENHGKGHKNAIEIGYFIDNAFWGQGYGTQIANISKKFIKYLCLNHQEFNINPKPEAIVATAHPLNHGSIKILQKVLKNQEEECFIKFGGNPRLLFFKPLMPTITTKNEPGQVSLLTQ